MKHYFYDKETGEYAGQTNCGATVPAGCKVSEKSPEDKAADQGQPSAGQRVDKKTAKRAVYTVKVAGYSSRQIQGALIRAKGFKRELLLAEQAKREQ